MHEDFDQVLVHFLNIKVKNVSPNISSNFCPLLQVGFLAQLVEQLLMVGGDPVSIPGKETFFFKNIFGVMKEERNSKIYLSSIVPLKNVPKMTCNCALSYSLLTSNIPYVPNSNDRCHLLIFFNLKVK